MFKYCITMKYSNISTISFSPSRNPGRHNSESQRKMSGGEGVLMDKRCGAGCKVPCRERRLIQTRVQRRPRTRIRILEKAGEEGEENPWDTPISPSSISLGTSDVVHLTCTTPLVLTCRAQGINLHHNQNITTYASSSMTTGDTRLCSSHTSTVRTPGTDSITQATACHYYSKGYSPQAFVDTANCSDTQVEMSIRPTEETKPSPTLAQ